VNQIHNIAKALNAVASVNPMATALITAGFVGELYYGTDAQRDALRPFGLLTAERVGGIANSSGVELVTYRVTLQVIAKENVNDAGNIIGVFSAYWTQKFLRTHLDLTDTLSTFVQIYPGKSEMGELEQQDMGKDIVSAVMSWTLELSESQPALE